MQVKLKINIGKDDARRLGLKETLEGSVVDVPEKVATEMFKNGWAADPSDEPKAEPKAAAPVTPTKIQAIPPVDVKTESATRPLPGK